MLYKKSELKNGLFIKVVTTSGKSTPLQKKIWNERYASKFPNETPDISFSNHAKYQAEFSTITEAAIGVIEEQTKGKLTSTVIPINGATEALLLKEFAVTMDKFPGLTLAGYNVTNYQAPLIIKRLLINKVPIPFLLSLKGKKPWEVSIIDVMRDYQGNMFGDVDIHLVASQFGINLKEKPTAIEELQATLDIAIAMSI